MLLLTTPRLLLRPFQPADIEPFAAYRSDPEVARYQSWETPYSTQQAAAFIAELQTTTPGKPGEWYQLALERKAQPGLIGDCAFQVLPGDPQQAEIGFSLAAQYQHQGYASEAVSRLLDYLFTDLNLHRVTATCDALNQASAHLLERVGMRREAHHLENIWFKGAWGSEYAYALLQREWDAKRPTGSSRRYENQTPQVLDTQMTLKVFWQDPYLTQLDANITTVNGDAITVDQTIFYAEAGGQESDAGTIGSYQVLQARKDGREIFYTLEVSHNLKPGDPVSIAIDWQRRYRLMRLHFAAELVLELAYQNLPGITKIGAHIAPDKSRIDFEWAESIANSFPLLQGEANRLIAEDHVIISAFSDETNERRYWKIEGFAQVACGGTHLKRTGEIGPITLKRKNIGKGKERVEIYLSD